MTKHKHADLMLQYAKDAAKTNKPWELWEWRVFKSHNDPSWVACWTHPSWECGVEYRRKPEQSDLLKYGVGVGDVWESEFGNSFFIAKVLNEQSFIALGGAKRSTDTLDRLLFRIGVVNKL